MDEEIRAARFAADISREGVHLAEERQVTTASDRRYSYFVTLCVLVAFLTLMFVIWRVNGDAIGMAERGFCWNGAQQRYEPCQWSQK